MIARRATCVLVLALSLALAALPALAAPSTPAIREKQTAADEARYALSEMAADLEERIEEYDALTEQLEETRVAVARTESELASATADRDETRRRLSSRAASIYKSGRLDLVHVLLGTSSFSDLLTRLDLLARVGRQDAELVSRVEDAVARVEAAESTLLTRQAEQVSLRAGALVKARDIETGMKRQATYVAALDAEVKQLITDEEERQRKLAEERARLAAEAAARAAQPASGVERAGATGGLGQGHPEVVTVALKYLGVRYVWGGSTPSGFDCSGLTQYSYAQAGLSIPRTSRSQYLAGTHIARDRLDLLAPGDLVFFGRNGDAGRVHHVGIYVGDGNFVHAPQTGDVVKVSSLTERIAERGDYVGASRF